VWAAGGLVFAGVVLVIGIGGLSRAVAHGAGAAADRLGTAVGLRVATLTIKGADAHSAGDIVAASGLHQGDPILALDLEAVRARIEGVGWVKSARVQRVLPDTIVVQVKQRSLLAVWQHGGLASVVDTEGAAIPEAQPDRFADLPLIVGEGANEAASEVLPLIAARPRLNARIDAFQRVDGRRWRLKLKDGGVIDLPAQGQEEALIRFDQLDASAHLLDMGFDRIDLRDPTRTDVRPKGSTSVAAQPANGGAVTGL
jgi:cell division protein FtsQ